MRYGFTLIELIVTVGLIAFLLTFSSLNFISTQRKTTLQDQVLLLSTDIRGQQLKAMSSDTGGSGTVSNYGIYFQNQTYTLFRGDTYSAIDPENYVVTLPETTIIVDVLFPNSQIVFQKGSGEILNFNNTQNTFSLTDSQLGESHLYTLNALGVIQ